MFRSRTHTILRAPSCSGSWTRSPYARRMLATTTAYQPQNMIEKIAQRYAVDLPPNHTVHSGDFVTIRPEHILTHDNTGAVMSK